MEALSPSPDAGRGGRPSGERVESGGGKFPELGNHALADRVQNQFWHAVEVQFLHQVATVGFDGVEADLERCGHFLIAFALGDKLPDFALAGRE